MSRYEDIKKKRGSKTEEEKDQGQTSVSRYQSIKESRGERTYGVDENFINTFIRDSQKFLKSSQEEYKGLSWQSATDNERNQSRDDTWSDLNSRSATIRAYLNANKSRMDEDAYNELTSYLDSLKSANDEVFHTFRNAENIYSQWDTQEEYDFWEARNTPEKRQRLYTDNLSRIDDLESFYDKAYAVETWYNSYQMNPDAWDQETVSKNMAIYNRLTSEFGSLSGLDAEIQRLKTDNTNYMRGNYSENGLYYGSKVVDDYHEVTKRENFAEDAAHRDYDNPTREELDKYDAMQDSSTWYYDANNVLRDAYGNEIVKDSTGHLVNPMAQAQDYAITDRLGMFLNATEKEREEYAGTIVSGTWGDIIGEGVDGSWEELTEGEIGIYYALLKNSPEEAYKYLKDMKTELNRRATQAKKEQWSQGYDEANFLEKIALSVATTPAQLVSGVVSTIEDTANTLKGEEINPYSAAHGGMHFSQTVRGKAAEDLDATGFKIPIINFTLGDLYQTGMSILDSWAAIGIGGGMGGALLATNAAASEATRLYEQGASIGQIAVGSAAAGAAEMVFESLSIEKLINMKDAKTVGQWIKNVLVQGGIEASEEGFTEIANILTNAIIMGSESDWAKLVEENDGDLWKAFLSEVQAVAHASLSGFFSGVGSASIPSAISYGATQNRYKDTGETINSAEGGVDALMTLANEVFGVSSAAQQKILSKQTAAVDRKATNKRVGRLYESVTNASNLANASQNKSDIAKSLERNGFNHETANDIAEALVASYNGQELTEAQSKLMERVKDSKAVQEAISNIVTNEKSTMGQRSQNIRDFNSDVKAGIISRATGMRLEAVKEAMKSKPSTAEEVSAESNYEVSADGKTIDTEGNTIDIVGVESIGDGKMILKTENGTIDSSEVVYATAADALVYEAVSRLDASPASAWAIIKGFKESDGVSAQVYATFIPFAYKYGKLNYRNGLLNLPLTSGQSATAFQMGRDDAAVETSEQASTESTISEKNADKKIIFEGFTYNEGNGKTKRKKGVVKSEGVTIADLKRTFNDTQGKAYKYLSTVAEVTGIDIVLYRSKPNADGKFVEAQGRYRRSEPGTIYIDLNAGLTDIKSADDLAKYAMLRTFAHEFTHFIENWNPIQYNEFRKVVFDTLAARGEDVDALIADKQARNPGMNPEQASREVVAEAMTDILPDTNFVQKLAENHKNIFQKLLDQLKEFVENLRDYFDSIGHNPSREANALKEQVGDTIQYLDSIVQMFDKVAVEAVENFQAGIAENQTSEQSNAVQEQSRKYLDKDKRKKQGKRSKYSETETLFLMWSNGAVPAGEVKRFIRFGKIHYYEKTENGCVEISKIQYNERNDRDAEKTYTRVQRQINGSADSNGDTSGNVSGSLVGNRNSRGTSGISGQTVGEKLRNDIRRSVSSGSGYNLGTAENQTSEQSDVVQEQSREYLEEHIPITADMTDAERYAVLKDRTISVTAKTQTEKLHSIEERIGQKAEDAILLTETDRKKLFTKIGEEFGVFKEYANADVKLTFNFSRGNLKESVGKQRKNYSDFAKMLSCFDEIIDTAIGIEIHNRNSEGYKPDPTLKNVYVLVSAFEDGSNIVPVKLEIKEFVDKDNTLYVAIALESIKKDEVVKQGNTENGVTQYSRSSIIKIADLFSKINPTDTSFLKYIPTQFLLQTDKADQNQQRANTPMDREKMALDSVAENDAQYQSRNYLSEDERNDNSGIRADAQGHSVANGETSGEAIYGRGDRADGRRTQKNKEWGNLSVRRRLKIVKAVSTHINSSKNYDEIRQYLAHTIGKSVTDMNLRDKEAAIEKLAQVLYESITDLNNSRPYVEQRWSFLGNVRPIIEAIYGENVQFQQRTSTLTDRDILAIAEERGITETLTDGQVGALQIFNKKNAEIGELFKQKAEQEKLLQNLQGAAKTDRAEITKTRNRIESIERQINQKSAKLREYEAMDSVKNILGKVKPAVEKRLIEERKKELAKYGTIPPGEKAVRESNLPQSTDGKNKVSRTARTVYEAGVTPEDFAELIDKEVYLKDGLSYLPVSNNDATQKAIDYITEEGWEAARGDWSAQVCSGKVSAELTAMGALLLNNAAKAGDKQTWLDILHVYQMMSTNAGQAVQALRILKTLTPDDRLYMARKSVSRMVKDLRLKRKIQVNTDLEAAYLAAETDGDRDHIMAQIQQDVADQIPATFKDKWTSLRYLNMLGNLRTQLRNLAGNTVMGLTVETKNLVAEGLEAMVALCTGGKYQKSKAFLANKDLLKAAFADYAVVKAIVSDGGKYNDQSAGSSDFAQGVMKKRKIFKNKALEKYRKATNLATENGDVPFSKWAYARALAGYLKQHGFNDNDLSKADTKLLEEARTYAVQEAQEATFHDLNMLSKWVIKVGRRKDTPAAVRVIADGAAPFRQTPANIAVRAEEYSLLGVFNSLYYTVQAARSKSDITPQQAINSWAKTITGSALFFVGWALAARGDLIGGPDDDEDKNRFEQMYGQQNYALKVGDTYVTIDWASPAAIPMLMGAQFYKLKEENGFQFKDFTGALSSLSDPLIQMSMLQGINDTLEKVKYSDNNLIQIAINSSLGYLTQGLTNSLVGQLERSFEDSRMTTYVDENSQIPNWLQQLLGKASAKVPGWDYNQIPYINAWGEEEENPGTLANLAYNMLSPSYISRDTKDAVYEELMRLDDAQSDKNVLPTTPEKTYDSRNLSAEEYVALAKAQGQTQRKLVEEIIATAEYKAMNDTNKAKAISFAYKYAKEKAQIDVLDREAFSAKWLNEIQGNATQAIIQHVLDQ